MYKRYPDIVVDGVVAAVPGNFVENSKYAEWIDPRMISRQSKLTGVNSRYLASQNTVLSDLLVPTAKDLMSKRTVDKNDIKVLVVVTETPDYVIPATANNIQKQLGIPEECLCIDINQGCGGAAVGIQVLCSLLAGQPSGTQGLLLMGNVIHDFSEEERENPDTILNQMIYGAGVAAVIFKVVDEAEPVICETLSYGNFVDSIYQKKDGSAVNEALQVVDFIYDIWAPEFREFLKKTGNDVDFYLLNQSQKMIMDTMMKSAGIEEGKALFSIQKFGDTYSASPFITLCYNRESLGKGTNRMLLAVSGSGMTCGFARLDIASDYIFELLYL
ncbi:MAG: hypothetical protein J1F22_04655 [Lachnospiraceae bacterium]|nr:hypothetical protein [Lachnospiraceae bacterium]